MKQNRKVLGLAGLASFVVFAVFVGLYFGLKSDRTYFGHGETPGLPTESVQLNPAPAEVAPAAKTLENDLPVREGAAPEPEARVDKSGLINIAEEVERVESEKPAVVETAAPVVVLEKKVADEEPQAVSATSTFAAQREFDPADIKNKVDERIQKSLAKGTLKPNQVRAYREYLTRLANEEALGEKHIVEQPADGALFADGAFLTDEN